MGTLHIGCEKEDMAEVVLMPGDPLRAKYIAENFLTDYKQINTIRNMFGYTGYYKGKKVTIMASGMGIPSMGIYSYELYKFFDVKKIIRIGTCGSDKKEVKVGDIVLADSAYSISTFGEVVKPGAGNIMEASKDLTNMISNKALEINLDIKRGMIYTSDVFDVYIDTSKIINGKDVLVSEMETYGLFIIASLLNKEAASVLTVVDSKFEDKIISSEDREKSLNDMIKLVLEAILS